jgi:hypothetical protein
VKVKADHGSGVFSTTGHLKSFRLDGDVLRADLHVLKTEKDREKLFEMAETIPDTFGLSISFDGPDEKIKGKMFARCSEIYSTDIVSEAAANPSGLFSAKESDSFKQLGQMLDRHIDKARACMDPAEDEDPITKFSKKFDQFAENIEKRFAKLEEKPAAEASEEDDAKTFAALETAHKEFGAKLEAIKTVKRFAAPVEKNPADGAVAIEKKELAKTPAQKGFAVLVQEAMAADKTLTKGAAVMKVSGEHPEVHREFCKTGGRNL